MTQLALRTFRLQNFKAVRDSGTIRLGSLTVFIGNNGSGKSSLIEGLETYKEVVLSGLDAAMNRWHGFEHVWNHSASQVLQQPADASAHHSSPLEFHTTGEVELTKYSAEMRVNLDEGGNRLFLQQERCKLSRRGSGSEYNRNEQGNVSIHGWAQSSSWSGESSATESTSSSSSVSATSGTSPPERPLPDGQSSMGALFGPFMESWQFLMLDPGRMGEPIAQQRASRKIRLARNGANIAEYLKEIHNLDPAAFQGIVDALQYVLPYAVDLQPTLTSELERKFYLKMKEADFEVLGWLLSTGTLRIVALLACLRHPKPPPLLVVEEIENGLDPRTLHLLVEELRTAIDAGTTQVIATTHSPYLLDLLDLSHIVVVEREDGQPVFRRPDEKQLAHWSKSFSPGHLYTMGRLTRGHA